MKALILEILWVWLKLETKDGSEEGERDVLLKV
jgi:hypothetical protein